MTRSPGRWNRRRSQAFTLLEVLVALLLVSIAAFGMSMLALHSLAAGNVAELQSRATLLLADAHALAAVGSLDAPAIARWQAAAASALPAPSDPLVAATVQDDPLDPGRRRRILALRWAEPGYPADRTAQLATLTPDWRP